MRANASKRKAMSYGRMHEEKRRLASEIDALLRSADTIDVAEDVRLGAGGPGRRVAGGVAAAGGSSGGDPGGEGAFGGGATGGGRRSGPAAAADPGPEGRPTVQAGVWGSLTGRRKSNFTDPESGS